MSVARPSTVVGRSNTVCRAALLFLSGLLLVAPFSVTASAEDATIGRPSRVDPYDAFIAQASQRFGMPERWIRAVMRVESAGNVRAISSAGAMGLMQIMPATWAELRVRHGLGTNPYDPRDNILAGAAYLREMFDRYGSPGFLAAYNAGPGRYEEYLAGRPLPAETRAYVATLVPSFGGGELPGPITVAVADPRAWTRAPLFVARAESTSFTGPAPTGSRSADTSAANPVRDVRAMLPHSDGLFVAQSDAGGPR
jgi:SLT domain-containing protein